ncbi:hypothetical protein BB561_000793 [Smittium simulii]|uniref:RRM domain-containing protein n=1 Tax=Smittium simulii TaxID=133385 RepID=A0A2T9YXN0_9FUNG|nr:hypothetical protein BB561_000793 [Smittium simulii]
MESSSKTNKTSKVSAEKQHKENKSKKTKKESKIEAVVTSSENPLESTIVSEVMPAVEPVKKSKKAKKTDNTSTEDPEKTKEVIKTKNSKKNSKVSPSSESNEIEKTVDIVESAIKTKKQKKTKSISTEKVEADIVDSNESNQKSELDKTSESEDSEKSIKKQKNKEKSKINSKKVITVAITENVPKDEEKSVLPTDLDPKSATSSQIINNNAKFNVASNPNTDLAAKSPKKQDTPKKRTAPGIWIGNLNYETSRESLIRFFKRVATPTRVKLSFIHKEKNKGFAYVDFETEELADQACDLSEQTLDDRVVLIKRSNVFDYEKNKQPNNKKRTHTDKNPTICIKNLSFNTAKKSLVDLALTFGNIVNVRCPTFPDNPRRIQGYAYIDFKSQASADKAVESLNGYSLNGREISAEYSSQNAYEQRS